MVFSSFQASCFSQAAMHFALIETIRGKSLKRGISPPSQPQSGLYLGIDFDFACNFLDLNIRSLIRTVSTLAF